MNEKKTLIIIVIVAVIITSVYTVGMASLIISNISKIGEQEDLISKIGEQEGFLENEYVKKGMIMGQVLDASIRSQEELEDEAKLQLYILKFIYFNSDVLQLNMSLPDDHGELRVFASSDRDFIGNPADDDNYISFEEKSNVSISTHTNESHTLRVITPMHYDGEVVGTYDILLLMDEEYAITYSQPSQPVGEIMIFIIGLIVIIISFLFLIKMFSSIIKKT